MSTRLKKCEYLFKAFKESEKPSKYCLFFSTHRSSSCTSSFVCEEMNLKVNEYICEKDQASTLPIGLLMSLEGEFLKCN